MKMRIIRILDIAHYMVILRDFLLLIFRWAKNEILYEDSASLYKLLDKNGIKTELDVEKDGWHVYQQMPLPIATRAMKRLAAFVSKEIYCEGRDE